MRVFLKAKHWQLFIVIVGSMFLTQLGIVTPSTTGFEISQAAMLFSILIMGLLYFGWLWAIADAGAKSLPSSLSSSPRPMQAGLIYALTYMLLSSLFFFGEANGLPGYIIAMHLLAMASIFYGLGFTAKQLCKLEQQKDVSFFTYSGPFFCSGFSLLGSGLFSLKLTNYWDKKMHNKRMQSDHPIRYANCLAADAGR
ncbi:MAG: hypothetical protein GKR94_33715 [Gammaproteobacteria bacterium]|nr:hypothetical protein [Gammaproteobacteria bacterium]